MSQAELAAWLESRDAHWCSQYQAAPAPAPDEESEIVAQFLAAPYPYQNDELGVVSATTSATYWPEPCHVTVTGPGAADTSNSNSSASGAGTGAYFFDSSGCSCVDDPIPPDPSPQPKRKVQAGWDGEDLGRHKKKSRASANHEKKAAPKTSQKCSQESSQLYLGIGPARPGTPAVSTASTASTSIAGCVPRVASSKHRKGVTAVVVVLRGQPSRDQVIVASHREHGIVALRKRRRERINERLKILQKLVPNGTKVDISTMLEEAVHYVRFLQQQIKMLSSDEMWMYAPIAYNGMSLGIDLKISPQRST
ncbi:uncharacterized protein [Miscanthus floridulus]|uniref:uncharacterized protein n=1 Tax=Miscanthus floridulus TaxID=154761 RepID=UPI003457E1D7